MQVIKRALHDNILSRLQAGKVIVLTGARHKGNWLGGFFKLS